MTVLPFGTFLLTVLRGRTAIRAFSKGSELDFDSNVYIIFLNMTYLLASLREQLLNFCEFHLRFFHKFPLWGISFRFKKENPFLIAFYLNHDIKSCNKLINLNCSLKSMKQIMNRNIFEKQTRNEVVATLWYTLPIERIHCAIEYQPSIPLSPGDVWFFLHTQDRSWYTYHKHSFVPLKSTLSRLPELELFTIDCLIKNLLHIIL